MKERGTFVLVHGAWHTSWVWDRTRAELATLGYDSVAVDLPSCGTVVATLGDLADDVAVIERAVAEIDGSVTVVAHSYGGIPASQADLSADVGLTFVTAFLPRPGESLVTSYESDGARNAEVRPAEGVIVFLQERARDVFYNDLDEAEAAAATALLVPQRLKAVVTPVDHASWLTNRAAYILCTEDHSIPLDVQRRFAARTVATRELRSSHSPMLSRPMELAGLIVELGEAVYR